MIGGALLCLAALAIWLAFEIIHATKHKDKGE